MRSLTKKHALINLPNSLVGRAAASEILDVPLPELGGGGDDDDGDGSGASPASWLFVGQVVRCVVLSSSQGSAEKGGKQIELSLRPSRVNKGLYPDDLIEGMTLSAAVASVEDHGCVLALGVAVRRRRRRARQPCTPLLRRRGARP